MNSAMASPGIPYSAISKEGRLNQLIVLPVNVIKTTTNQAAKKAPNIWKTPDKQLKMTCLHTVPIWPTGESAKLKKKEMERQMVKLHDLKKFENVLNLLYRL